MTHKPFYSSTSAEIGTEIPLSHYGQDPTSQPTQSRGIKREAPPSDPAIEPKAKKLSQDMHREYASAATARQNINGEPYAPPTPFPFEKRSITVEEISKIINAHRDRLLEAKDKEMESMWEELRPIMEKVILQPLDV